MLNFEKLLQESVKFHGHLCPGQVLGVRMAILGLKLIDIHDPKGKDRKSLIAYVEIDRCATDAIMSVTGCTPGKRSLKILDNGIMAASFINLKTGSAFRIIAKEESKEAASNYFPDIEDKYERQKQAYKIMSDEELFDIRSIKINIPDYDMPGRPLKRIKCEKCGDFIQDCKDIAMDGKILCKSCAYGAYYSYL
jgi:formylmethanofuran dehydrogenase subunit E